MIDDIFWEQLPEHEHKKGCSYLFCLLLTGCFLVSLGFIPDDQIPQCLSNRLEHWPMVENLPPGGNLIDNCYYHRKSEFSKMEVLLSPFSLEAAHDLSSQQLFHLGLQSSIWITPAKGSGIIQFFVVEYLHARTFFHGWEQTPSCSIPM